MAGLGERSLLHVRLEMRRLRRLTERSRRRPPAVDGRWRLRLGTRQPVQRLRGHPGLGRRRTSIDQVLEELACEIVPALAFRAVTGRKNLGRGKLRRLMHRHDDTSLSNHGAMLSNSRPAVSMRHEVLY